MCFCGVEPDISNLWTGENAGSRWERCVARRCRYFVWLDEPLTGRALEAIEELYTEMQRKMYDMKQEMWAEGKCQTFRGYGEGAGARTCYQAYLTVQ